MPNMKKAIVIDITEKRSAKGEREARMAELQSLVKTYGNIEVVASLSKKTKTDLKLYLREGLREEAMMECKKYGVDTIILGNILKPRQIYELSEYFKEEKVEIWDRIDLILKIFSQHAQSSEAKLQIKLAKLKHMGPRIFGLGGEELSKQGGGIGAKGQGESNTEIMKRHLRREKKHTIEKIEKLEKTQSLQRKNRKRRFGETVSLVGYTNAGKSSLMNTLSKKGVETEDALFKTLDTRIGKMFLPQLQKEIFLSDTIGFMGDLPPDLIDAFRSTLSEAVESDILLHVVDLSDPRRLEKMAVVDEILEQLDLSNKKQIIVFNKIDQAGERFGKARLRRKFKGKNFVFCSAHTKQGLDQLQWKIGEILGT